MSALRDRFNRFSGKTRFVVCRIFLQLAGKEATPLLGVLNQAAQSAIDADGDMKVLGEGLVDICQSLLQYEVHWHAAANEGDVLWDEGEAGDYVTELFTDSAQRYKSSSSFQPESIASVDDPLALNATSNLVVMITIACEGEVPELETDLSHFADLKAGLTALINLHYQDRLRAIQVHYSPAQFGDELTADQILANFPELLPL